MMEMTIDLSEEVTKWKPPQSKEWETVGDTNYYYVMVSNVVRN